MLTSLLCSLLSVASYGILIWVILSWIPTTEGHPLRSAKDFLDRVFMPLLRPIRGLISPVRLGGVGLDLSPVVLILGVLVLQRIIC